MLRTEDTCALPSIGSATLQTCDLTFGIIGMGRVGTAAARLAKAFGFDVCYYDPYLAAEKKIAEIDCSPGLEGLLQRADVISLHCPLFQETRHLIGERELSWMKPTAIIINTASVGIVHKKSVLAALKEGRLGGAGFGVSEDEAIEAFSPAEIATVPNLLIICHEAFSHTEP